ncbi:MAG: pyridoxal-phosphate dependent enzyme [Emcibacteraceae bacterium]|nr:pyridoxal-phosphate dependent enzyme [Emcibacteraceae bacterium]
MFKKISQTDDHASPRLSISQIEEAAKTIDKVFMNTPQYVAESLSEILGVRTVVKMEIANPIRCFKGRGADFVIANLAAGSKVITASAGNLGQAMAYACRRRGVELTVYASVNANTLKIERMRALGANVILHGIDFDAAKIEAKRVANASSYIMVEDGREQKLSEGAGSIAVELMCFPEKIDTVLVALGNGAMLGGMAQYIKAKFPDTEVIGVAATGAPCMEQSWRTNEIVETEQINTIADGIGTRIPIPEALEDIRVVIDDILLVEDDQMIQGMQLAYHHLGVVLEPSGAAGIAALLANPKRFQGRTVATILCGGNLTVEQMSCWLN